MSGSDSVAVGDDIAPSTVTYSGEQTLIIERHGSSTRYIVRAHYTRNAGSQGNDASASFESTVDASGEQHDERDLDPDYLTVLNQPFAVQLDSATLRDLGSLHSREIFDFASPMTGDPLHGFLAPLGRSFLARRAVVGVAFIANGRLHGGLPSRPNLTLRGKIRVSGRAYYRVSDALLMQLDATLTISGTLVDRAHDRPVTIVYRRAITSP
jgi:hypothetical protein